MKSALKRAISIFLVITILFSMNIVINAATPTTLFSDGFESGNFTSGSWTNSGCEIQTTYKNAGTRAARLNSSDILTKSYSTVNYQSIQISYARMTSACEADDHFICEWYNGSAWTILEDVTGNSNWSVKTWSLPTAANNISNFSIRFKTSHNGSTDYAYLDDVNIIGTALPDTQAPTSPSNLTCTSKTDTTVTLTWGASTDNVGVTGYDIYSNGTLIGTATNTNYTIGGLLQYTTYSFIVKAKDLAGNISISSNELVATTERTPKTLFTDGFESNNFTVGGWVNSGCDTQTTNRYTGTSAARCNSSDTLTKSISTMTYQNIKISYSRMTSACETDDHFICEWYNGSTWATLEDLTGNSSWAVKTWSLPSMAENNANIQVRFKTSHNGSTDYAYLDDVKVVGTEIPDTQAPTPPMNLACSLRTGTEITLSWSASSDNIGVTGYDIYNGSILVGSTSTDVTYTVTGLGQGTQYSFSVIAKDAASNFSQPSTLTVSTMDTEAPTPPSGLSVVSKTDTAVTLSWTASTDNVGVAGYDVFCNGNPTGSTNGDTTITITGLTQGTSYTFFTKARDIQGNISLNSNVTSVVTNDSQAPTAPTELSLVEKTDSTASLSWVASSDNLGVYRYDVYADGSLVGTTPETTYTVTGLVSGESFTFVVRARDNAGNISPDSNVCSVTTDFVDIEAPSTPSGLQVISKTDSTIEIAWTASIDNIGVSSYEIYSGSELVGSSILCGYTFTGLAPLTEYSFSILARDASGNTSSMSDLLTVTTEGNGEPTPTPTPPPSLPAPQNLSALANDISVLLSWEQVIGAIGYEIYRNDELLAETEINSYTDENVDNITYYVYYVKAFSNDGLQSEPSNTATIGTNDDIAPTAPANLRVISKTETSAVIAWDPSTDNVGVSSYDIYADGTLVGTTTGDVTQYDFSITEKGHYYIISVRAKDTKGNESVPSNSIQIIDSTHVNYYITHDTTWTINSSPYILEIDIIVSQGTILNIDTGVYNAPIG